MKGTWERIDWKETPHHDFLFSMKQKLLQWLNHHQKPMQNYTQRFTICFAPSSPLASGVYNYAFFPNLGYKHNFKNKLSFIYNYLFISSFFRIKSSSWAELVLWVGLTPQSPLPLHSCSHWGNIYFFYWSGNYEKWESYDWKCGVRVRVSCLLTLK